MKKSVGLAIEQDRRPEGVTMYFKTLEKRYCAMNKHFFFIGMVISPFRYFDVEIIHIHAHMHAGKRIYTYACMHKMPHRSSMYTHAHNGGGGGDETSIRLRLILNSTSHFHLFFFFLLASNLPPNGPIRKKLRYHQCLSSFFFLSWSFRRIFEINTVMLFLNN